MSYPEEYRSFSLLQLVCSSALFIACLVLLLYHLSFADSTSIIVFAILFITVCLWFMAASSAWFIKSEHSYAFMITSSLLWFFLLLYLFSGYIFAWHPFKIEENMNYYLAVFVLDIIVLNLIYSLSILTTRHVMDWPGKLKSTPLSAANAIMMLLFLASLASLVLLHVRYYM